MIKKVTLILFLITSIFLLNNNIKAEEQKNLVNIYFFHSNTCSHCKEENEFLSELEKKYNNINIYKYEIHESPNQEILKKAEEFYKQKINSVPFTIIGNKVYTGFSEKSKIKFIKTIEYYSKYGYKDDLGIFLNLKLPTYTINEKDISLEKFIDTYHNYNLLGLKTDNLEPNSISLLLGLLSVLNITSILGIILVVLITVKIKNIKIKLSLQALYVIASSLLLINNLIKSRIYLIAVYLIITLLVIYCIIKIIKRKKQYLSFILVSLIAIITNLLINNSNITIFKNILNLHNLTGLNKIYYYGNYLLIYFIINLMILYFISVLGNSIFKKRNI